MPGDPEKIYRDGYSAFDHGNFEEAIKAAGKCLLVAPIDSYWFPGALGLRCWAANFAGDRNSVERDAHALLALDTDDEKMWFDGLAAFNLALIRRRLGDVGEAETLFDQARAKYAAYRINPKKPDEWRLVRELFESLSHWAACGELNKLDDMAGRLSVLSDLSGEILHIQKAVDLYQRFARGDNVVEEAQQATDNGVSRTFLALILI